MAEIINLKQYFGGNSPHSSRNTNWIIKHALSNRAKQSDREAVKIVRRCG